MSWRFMRPASSSARRAQPWLGTFVETAATGPSAASVHAAIDGAFATVATVHRLMSFHDDASDVSRVNRHAAVETVRVHPWTYDVLKAARDLLGYPPETAGRYMTPQYVAIRADMTAREHKFDNVAAIRTFTGHKDWVYTVAFNPGTKKLATGSWDGEVRIWNADDSKGLVTFTAAPGYPASAAPAAAK